MRYLLANWKMHTTVGEAVALLVRIQEGLRDRARRGAPLPLPIVCPPFVSIMPMRAVADPELVRLGAQNCHWEPQGPFTGEVSAPMLADLVDYVLIGHSERRAAGETDEQFALKVAAAAEAGLTPILFVGEDEPSSSATQETARRLEAGLARADLARRHVVIVYEPTWAVDAERPAEAEHVEGVVARLKDKLVELGAERPEVIYGGTVNDANVDELARLEVLDGLGATRASLRPETFFTVIDRMAPTVA